MCQRVVVVVHSRAVHAAAFGGHNDTIRFFAGANVDCNVLDSFGRTPLHYAAGTSSAEVRACFHGRRRDVCDIGEGLCAKRGSVHWESTGDTPFLQSPLLIFAVKHRVTPSLETCLACKVFVKI